MEGRSGTEKQKSPQEKLKTKAILKEQKVKQAGSVPKGLVGRKSTANVEVGGVGCNCLLDTGSQVTTISQSFYNDHLLEYIIKPVSDILEVEGANGEPVPYAGYVEISLKFPKEFIASEPEVETLALIVPDTRSNSSIPVLIGTNTLDPLYEEYCDDNPLRSTTFCGYAQVLRTLQLRHQQRFGGRLGLVKLRGSIPATIPAGEKVILQGVAGARTVTNESWVLLEPPSMSSLPGGIFTDCCLITMPTQHPYKVPVILRNETEHDITLPTNCIIAELAVVQDILQDTHPYQKPTNPDEESFPSENQRDAATSRRQEKKLKLDFGDSPLSEEWKTRITEKLNNYSDVFAHHDLDFGHTTKVKHHIRLKDETPFKQRPRPIHPQDFEAVRRHLKTLLDAGVIRESESPFSSPIVVVKKKNGDIRLCVDYRKLNLQTIRDAYALPNLEESFSALSGSQWFSVMDLKSGYYQIEMEESDKQKTAFVCPLGFWEWNRMPQGITNAPSTFQRLIEKCMGDMHLREVLVFLDDLIVFSKSLEEHEKRLSVLNRLRDSGLKLSPEKCCFFQTSVRYLGHIVSRDRVETDPEKVKALKTWPRPQTLKELKSFLGFSGYYRRFVQDYAKIVKPLTNLTAGYPPTQRRSKPTQPPGKYFHPKEPFQERWTSACQQAFENIIDKLTSSPVLGFANPKLPYTLHTDASTTGLGAALYQEQDGQSRVIAYASRGLSRSEARYPAHKLEFLALKWAITEKFHDYLYGNYFRVVTDNNPLRYILTTAKLDATSYRWLASLSTFTFDITYRAGKQNQDADGLSRRPHGDLINDNQSQGESQRIHEFTSHHLNPERNEFCCTETVRAVCQYHIFACGEEDSTNPCLVESLAIHSVAIPTEFEEEGFQGLLTVPKYSTDKLATLQREDPVISNIIKLIQSQEPVPTSRKTESPEFQLMLREMSRFELKDDLLYRRRQCDNRPVFQLVLPHVLRSSVLTSLHNQMGHMGIERTLELVRSRFYWPKMVSDIETKIKNCERCVKRKSQPEKAAPLVNIHTSRPMELVCMDFLSLEPDSHNTKDILVITDHFTRYAVAIPTRDQKASTVTKCLWEQFLSHYGFPERLHSDQGRDFESRTIKELCALAGIRKVRTSPYHPRGNPVEQFNRTLLSMLGTLQEKEKTKWRDHVKPLTHAYNCTRNNATGFSPYELMFGRQPRLPIDIAFGLPVKDSSSISHSQYVKNLKSQLRESYQLATKNAKKVADKNKQRFDVRVRESTLEAGDRVLVRNLRLRQKHKLADRWESKVYIVQKRAGDLPVYVVCPEGQDGPTRTLHRDLLLPCGFLSEEEEEVVEPKPARRLRTKQILPQPSEQLICSEDDDDIEPQFYPIKVSEVETTLFKVMDMLKENGEAAYRRSTSAGAEYLPVDSETLPGMEQQTLPDVSSAVNGPNFVGRSSMYLEPEENLPGAVVQPEEITEKMDGDMETETVNEINTSQMEKEPLVQHPEEYLHEQLAIGREDSQCQSQKEGPQIVTTIDPSSTVETDNDINEIASEPPRRSERSRRAPRKFTYPQFGSPLISFAQTILEGFNQVLVEKFESNQ